MPIDLFRFYRIGGNIWVVTLGIPFTMDIILVLTFPDDVTIIIFESDCN